MELLDIVNELDEVVGQALQQDIYAQKHPHRIVHVLVFNAWGELALQQRAAHESFFPLHWGTTIGGHVQAGETYETAAHRESLEEVGQQFSLTSLTKLKYFSPHSETVKFLQIFTATADTQLAPASDEGAAVQFFPLEKIQEMIHANEKFMPELLFILQKAYQISPK